ncbi:uncharacterized protein RSE6_02943 [Rhynchosporium secalis]|uniref:FAD-dependent oxidoreductase-like enzyme n=1 Tax=Rhynchosporium secalis TaxID=38038 RepID=A0A1E1M1J5_RHYSE|nr:uncharacterized protein RSE6_02943 [Rhynchosporium secalis]
MASQSSFEGVATPVENPSTPQPIGTEVLSKDEMPPGNSPTTSMMVTGSASSMTPPPSSQPPLRRPASAQRTITPEPKVLSSPPPTVTNGNKRDAARNALPARPTADQIADASLEEMRAMMLRVVAENEKMDMAISEARMSAAHYKLQHNLLSIESEEALKRMEVENDIIRREVQVLQVNGRDTTTTDYTQRLKAYCKSVEEDNVLHRRRLEKAKRLLDTKDEEIMEAKDEIFRLQQRIRQNREHINILRSPGGPLHISTPKTTPATPLQYRGTPKYTPTTNRSIRYGPSADNQEKFNALLLAGSVLSQENTSAPSTPTVARRPDPRTPNRHNRGVQSLSAFPTTTLGSARSVGNNTLLPSAQFTPQAEARVVTTLSQHVAQHSRERRRKSRDSTISASDAEEFTGSGNYRGESEEIQESQASQSATEMLRVDPRESFEVAASRTHTPVPNDKHLHQAKLYAPVSKRKLDHDHGESVKKMRHESVGLGIGFESGRM